MSGRKASEVNALLRNGEQTRKASIDILKDTYTKLREFSGYAKDKKSAFDNAKKAFDYTISETARKEFPDAAAELERKIDAFLKSADVVIPQCSDNALNGINSEYIQTDAEADKVRELIKSIIAKQGRSDPWYCDAEYKRANQICEKYSELSVRVKNATSDSSKQIAKLMSSVSQIDEKTNQIEKFKAAIGELEKKAAAAEKLRNEASAARQSVEDEMKSIDNDMAVKFLKDEFVKLQDSCNKYLRLADNEIVVQYNGLMSQVIAFKNSLNVEYSLYMEEKNRLLAMLEAAVERINDKEYTNPGDEFRNISQKEQLSLIEFLDKYCGGKYSSELSGYITKIQNMIDSDKFSDAENALNEMRSVIDDGSDLALSTHENQMKTITQMLSLQAAMISLGYKVNVTGDANGYCVECSAGDESITFDPIAVNGDGKVTIPINHKESTNGTCMATWHDIRKRLAEYDVFIEDVLKNGKSIHLANTVKKSMNSGVTQAHN